MDKADFYNTNVPPELLETRNDYIQERGKELYEFLVKHTDEMLKYFFYVNAGGAVAILGLMGASVLTYWSASLKMTLLSYALGLACVGVLRVLVLHRIESVRNSWGKDVTKYWNQQIGYNKLILQRNIVISHAVHTISID